MRINRYIATCGVCSRRDADNLIKNNKVKINGDIAASFNIVKSKDIVEVNGKQIGIENKKYIMLNKPKGYLSAVSDERDKVVTDLIDLNERMLPVGRLDKDSEGLLLLTNDGDLINKLTHPKYKIWKKYYVVLHQDIDKQTLDKISKGIYLKKWEYKTLPSRIDQLSSKEVYISIREGKKREIRRMFQSVRNSVKHLQRIAIEKLELGKLKIGTYRYLTKTEVEYLKNLAQ